jgi:hypothetical protein
MRASSSGLDTDRTVVAPPQACAFSALYYTLLQFWRLGGENEFWQDG